MLIEKTSKKPAYKVFGLRVSSEILLPELHQLSNDEEGTVDVLIEFADLTKQWNDLAVEQRKFVVKENIVMFQISNTATFSIQDGEKIIVSPIEGYAEDKARLYILGTCMGALLLQRKTFPLHGSAIAIDGKAYAFVGDSGAGKSTLASAFLSRGYQLLSDDVIAVTFSQDRQIPIVSPSYPQQKLWQESLNQFGMEASHYRPLFERETKYAVPVSSKFFEEPLPLAGVFELVKTEDEKIGLHRIEKLERLRILYYHTYRNFLVRRLGLREWHFQSSASIINQIDVFQLRRPASWFTANELASLILNSIKQGGIKNDHHSKDFAR
jgi:hypothetical protein